MKVCRECLATKPTAEFYVHPKMADGHLSRCKDCVKARVRAHYAATRPERSAYEKKRSQTVRRSEHRALARVLHRQRHPDRYRARMAVGNAIRDGRLFRGPCVHCGTTVKVQAHHEDYSKPLDVVWTCFPCHREREHGQVVTAR